MRKAGYDDVERGERGSSEKHLTVTQFKVEKEQARLADLQEHNAEMLNMAAQLVSEKEAAEKEAKQAQGQAGQGCSDAKKHGKAGSGIS